MITISLCMIVKDEEDVLARCLDSVHTLVDEIIIVDTGSSDSTIEIAKRYTEKIFNFEWIDDFSAARNYSFSKANCDYIMWLDADDVIEAKDALLFLQLKETLCTEVNMVMMKYDVAFDEKGSTTLSYNRERLMRRDFGYIWVGPIHEVIQPSGNITYENIAISHKKLKKNKPQRNLKIFEKLLSTGKRLDPRQTFYYGRELYYNARYEDAIKIFEKFLEEKQGWIENNIEACRNLSQCYILIDQREKGLNSLLRSFQYDTPRAEICCDIGEYFIQNADYKMAIFWYEQAIIKEPKEDQGGFCQKECYGYLPSIQLCVCYDRMGMVEKAISMNEEAGRWKPEDEAVVYNRNYFNNINNKV